MTFSSTARRWRRLTSLLGLLGSLSVPALAQTPGVGIGATTFTPDASALLELRSITQGVLAPRMTAAQRNAIASPAPGLLVYQTDGAQLGLWQNQGTTTTPDWQRVGDNLGNHTATQHLVTGSYELRRTSTSPGVGVGSNGGLQMGMATGNNIYLGYDAGLNTTTGLYNTFMGYLSGRSNTTGSGNVFYGFHSGINNTSGSANYFSGYQAGQSNNTGQFNHFVGYQSGWENTSGGSNYFSGFQAGYRNTTGSYNQFIGYQAGYSNTTGQYNHFSGFNSGLANLTGNHNTFSGTYSGNRNTVGSSNVFVGHESGDDNTTGNNNVFVGPESGAGNVTGSNNYAFGYQAGPMADGLTNAGAIGHRARVGQSNSLVLGGTGSDAVRVGIGTSTPTQALEVAGQVYSSTGGFRFPDGTVQTTAAATAAPVTTTASNGLTKTGNDIALGGALTAATQLAINGNSLGFINGGGAGTVDQVSYAATAAGNPSTPTWQTFTPGVAGQLTRLELPMRSITGASITTDVTVSVYSGATTSGTPVAVATKSATFPHTTEGTTVAFDFATAPALVAGATYTFQLTAPTAVSARQSCEGIYPGGRDAFAASCDLLFRTYMRSDASTVLALNATGNVGVGTAAPTQKLEVAGSVKLSGAGNGLHFPDGTVQTTAAASGSSATADNGLTKTGNNIALGGALTQPTRVVTGTNSLSFLSNDGTGSFVDQENTIGSAGASMGGWQSFTPSVTGELMTFETGYNGTGSTVFTVALHAGTGTGSTPLYSFTQPTTIPTNGSMTVFTFPAPPTVTAGQVYTVSVIPSTSLGSWRLNYANSYAGGRSFNAPDWDLAFRTTMRTGTATTLALSGSGQVGIGTAAPTQKLEVAGQVYSSTGGFRFPDGTVQTTAAVAPAATTASNGLTKTGDDIALGGTLAANTVVIQANKSFSFTGGNVGLAVNSSAEVTSPVTVGSALAVPFVETSTGSSLTLTSLHHTVRRVNSCNAITLPDPSTCRGRVYTLINSTAGGTTNLTLTVSGGASIYDDVLGSAVSTLASAKRLTVQSSGTTWIVISRD
ncbi:beta strand repeat-containing protein [Hymenobacter coalescens]